MANRFDLCIDLNTGFPPVVRSDKHTHSVLFGNVAQLNLQFDMLDLNTGLALVVKTPPNETFSLIWVNREGIHTLFRFMNTLVRFRVDFESGHWICSWLTYSFPQYWLHWFDVLRL